MKNRIIYYVLSKISHYSSKISVWSWQQLWGNKKTGKGYNRK
tara:strand:+ start:334 stop:459 length:126 start_codon:yes stop_codon:yes gene_type:complete